MIQIADWAHIPRDYGTIQWANLQTFLMCRIDDRQQLGPSALLRLFDWEHEGDQQELRRAGYDPNVYYHKNAELRRALDQIRDGFFSPEQKNLFQPIIDALLHQGDYFMVLADYEAYVKEQEKVEKLYRDQNEWNRKAIINVAKVGKFSSDRTIKDYNDEIWQSEQVNLPGEAIS
ncbi:MAG: glycogen/starch/alpha-glucan phosphorylase [Balneolales bacterium]|nr:glycogen/starch/alpha-glucan phosphorylase [Balneolales bacterium]